MRGRSLFALAGWILLSLMAGVLGAVVSGPNAWYSSLDKPPWTPPPWLFGPVWTTLYVMMGVAAWLVWLRREEQPVRTALVLFGVQLALNALWSWIFFGMQNPGLALLELLLLWGVLAATIALFARSQKVAAALLLPYLAWVSFAGALNASIWLGNV